MVRTVQHVGVPGYPFQAAVLWDGSLVFGRLGFRELKVMPVHAEINGQPATVLANDVIQLPRERERDYRLTGHF